MRSIPDLYGLDYGDNSADRLEREGQSLQKQYINCHFWTISQITLLCGK